MIPEPNRIQDRVGGLPGLPVTIWERTGITQHLGGTGATARLLAMRPLPAHPAVLEIGCGTGYTACRIARERQARVVALDILSPNVIKAHRRVAAEELASRISIVRGDAHHLPCPSGAFDLVLAESVLVFGNAEQMAREAHRVLKPGGELAINELTLRAPPPERLTFMLEEIFGIAACQQSDWRAVLEQAGFSRVMFEIRPLRFREQLLYHVRSDGWRAYLSALGTGVANTPLRTRFFNREMLRAAFHFLPYVGYGLYSGRKLG